MRSFPTYRGKDGKYYAILSPEDVINGLKYALKTGLMTQEEYDKQIKAIEEAEKKHKEVMDSN